MKAAQTPDCLDLCWQSGLVRNAYTCEKNRKINKVTVCSLSKNIARKKGQGLNRNNKTLGRLADCSGSILQNVPQMNLTVRKIYERLI